MKVIREIETNAKIMGAGLLNAAEAETLPSRLKIYKDWWWTCTAGTDENLVVVVYDNGKVNHYGRSVDTNFVFVRPMLIVSGVEVGDVFSFGGREFEVVQEGIAFCRGDIGLCCFNEWGKNMANMYVFSEVEAFVNQWFARAMNRVSNVNDADDVTITGATLLTIEEVKTLHSQISSYDFWWWARSSGESPSYAATVYSDGWVYYRKDYVTYGSGAVRPALNIDLESSTLKVGDCFTFGGKEFEIISNSLAFCKNSIGYHCFRYDYNAADANVYEVSDVKRFVDEWFKEACE